MRLPRFFALLVATLLLLPVGAQTTAPLSDWRGQLYMRATWLQGKTPILAAAARFDVYATSRLQGTYVLQGTTGTALWNLSGLVFAADITDTKVGALVTGHMAHALAYGPYRAGTTSRDAVMEVWVTAPDVGTPTLRYKINALDKQKPPTYQGAPMTPLTTGMLGTGYAWVFVPLSLPAK